VPFEPPDELLRIIDEGKVIVVVGSGVSIAATGGAPEASWEGLLKSGVRCCRFTDQSLEEGWERRRCEDIADSKHGGHLLAAEDIASKLGAPKGGAFAGWLRDTLGSLAIRDRRLLDALAALKAPLVTTNYDGLLEKATGFPPITWMDEGKVGRLLMKEQDSDAIYHLHGYWDRPESVVLGIRSYEGVRGSEHAQAVLRASAMQQTLLFVGCGDGLRDPNFGPFLSWLGVVNRSRETPHYRLALQKDVVALAREHAPEQRIQIVPYGEGHGDLAPFLEKLVRDRPRPQGTTAAGSGGGLAGEAMTPAVSAYLRRLGESVSKLHLIGFGRGIPISLPIRDAYIPLRAAVTRELGDRRTGHSKEQVSEGRGYCERDIELARVFEVARSFGHRGVLLLGDPGSGKTTGARQFCWRVLHPAKAGETPGLPVGCLPVFLRLRDLTPDLLARDLASFIAEYVGSNSLPSVEAQPGPDLIARRGVLWVFDGLDEVVNEDARVRVCEWIQRWAEDRPADAILVTSRYQGYQGRVDLGSDFCQFHVQPLQPDQSSEFVRRWYKTVLRRLFPADTDAETRGAAEANDLLGLLSADAYRIGGLRQLPTNPLLLTILCLVHHEDHSLPRKRVDVYARCVRVLLESWRKDLQTAWGSITFDAGAAEGVLGSLAWWLHGEENRTSGTVPELGDQSKSALAEVSVSSGLGRDGEAFVKRMRDESGILAMWGSGRCGFLHLSFQEYFAGLHAAREGHASILVERMANSWWREVLLVSLAMGPRKFALGFFEALLRTETTRWDVTLVDQCLDEASIVPMEPFLAALGEPSRTPSAKAAILRRLKLIPNPDVTEACRKLASSADQELSAVAREVLQRSGSGIKGPGESELRTSSEGFVDPRTGIAYVALYGGEFTMGTERFGPEERPAHQVRISAFTIGRYPITNAEYARFLELNPGQTIPAFWTSSQFNDPRQPVVGVSWDEAQAFCRWAGARLPTEAEWEYACRAGTTTTYYFGNDPKDLGAFGWFVENSGGHTHPVGEKKPNPWGLHDLHGNVWEWCEDAWDMKAYRTRASGLVRDPVVSSDITEAKDAVRVVRGGSSLHDAVGCRSAYRFRRRPDFRNLDLGFRVCLVRSPVLKEGDRSIQPGTSEDRREGEAQRVREGRP
jgi:formylglycine-generating enzyme required for sulfatase activity